MAIRIRQPWTSTESRLWRALKRALPDHEVLAQWWLPGQDYRVDFFLPALKMVVEIDGRSHQWSTGADRLRSLLIRDAGYQIARVTGDDVIRDVERITAQIVFRLLPDPHAEFFDSDIGEAADPGEAEAA